MKAHLEYIVDFSENATNIELAEFFTNAEIHVESDMVGAVLSTCGDEQGE